MTKESNDLYHVASLIEYTARKTKNRLKDVVTAIVLQPAIP